MCVDTSQVGGLTKQSNRAHQQPELVLAHESTSVRCARVMIINLLPLGASNFELVSWLSLPLPMRLLLTHPLARPLAFEYHSKSLLCCHCF